MNIRQTVKRMSAFGAGALMVGATVMGAMAYDLSDYPSPFVQDGVYNAKIVVGERAASLDILGAIDIAASLQAAATVPVSTSGGSVSVEGGEDYDEQTLNGAWTGVNLTETKLEGFRDTTTDFDDEDIDYHDVLMLGTNALRLRTSSYEEDFGDTIYMTTDASQIMYRVYFDDYVNTTLIGTGTGEDELEFYMLGKLLTVQSADSDSITIEASSEQFLEQGEEVEIDDRTVTLVRVGETSVIVEVDGQRQVISDGASKTFDDAGDFEVEVDSIFYVEGAADNGAYLKLGADLTESADDGDSAQVFGEPKEEDEADWLWDISMGGTSNQYIGLVNNIDRTDLDSDAENRPALKVGESLDLPNGYAQIWFYELEEPADYVTLEVEVHDDGISLDDDSTEERDDVPGLVFTTDSGNDDFVVDTVETSKVWVVMNESSGGTREIWYEDGDDETKATDTTFWVQLDDDYIIVTPPPDLRSTSGWSVLNSTANSTGAFKMNFTESGTAVDTLWFFVDVDNDFFGLEDDDESYELVYAAAPTGFTGGTALASLDYDFVTNYGAIVPEGENQFGSGSSFEIMLPTNRQKGTIVVTSRGTIVGASSTGGAYQVNPFDVGAAVLDKDAESLLGDEPLIVVGGPYVNTVAAELMGNPSGTDIEEMFKAGRAKIKLYEDQNALLVAGYTGTDTVGASYVLAEYSKYDLSGTEVEVVVPSLSQISVTTPTLPSDVDDIEEEVMDEE